MFKKKQNYSNDNDSQILRQLMYLSMIDGHIISIEFNSNSFNVIHVLTQKHILQKDVHYEFKCSK
jgi:hypothetical protein